MAKHLGRNFETDKKYLKFKWFSLRESRARSWRNGVCSWAIKVAFHSRQAAALATQFLGQFLRKRLQITNANDLSVYYKGVIRCTDAYNYPLGKQESNFFFSRSQFSLLFFVLLESDIIPNLLQDGTNLLPLRSAEAKTLTIPVVVHYDAFASETGLAVWGLNPPNHSLYDKGCSEPQMVSGFAGKEGRLSIFANFIFALLLSAFRSIYKLPSIPHILFQFVLCFLVCMFLVQKRFWNSNRS